MCNLLGDAACCAQMELVARTRGTLPITIAASGIFELGIWDVLRLRSLNTLAADALVGAATDVPSPRFRGWTKNVSTTAANGVVVFQERSSTSDAWYVVDTFEVGSNGVDLVQPFGRVATARFVRGFIRNNDTANQLKVLCSLISGSDW